MIRGLVVIGTAAVLLAACNQTTDNNANGNAAATNEQGTAKPDGNLASVLGSDQRFTALVNAAGMKAVLEGKAPYTVLAPTSQALDALPAGTLERLQSPAGRPELTALLRRHILPGTILAADLQRAVETGKGKATLATMAGEPLNVTRDGQTLTISDGRGARVRITGNEQLATNGVVHQIDGVLPAPSP